MVDVQLEWVAARFITHAFVYTILSVQGCIGQHWQNNNALEYTVCCS